MDVPGSRPGAGSAHQGVIRHCLQLAILDVNSAEHVTATYTSAVFAPGIGYDRVHGCGRHRAAGTLYDWHPADFDFVHFLFSAYVCIIAFFQ
jgi:hypothetical protein